MVVRILSFLIALFISVNSWGASQQASATLASAMITSARYYLDESTADYWSDAELLGWLNDGMIDIAAKTNCLEATESVTLLPNTIEYTISSAYTTVKDVIYNGTYRKKALIKGNLRSVGSEMQTTEPTYWYEFAGKVGIYPALILITDAGLAIGSTTTAVSNVAFNYSINGVVYSKAAVAAGTAPGNDVIPTGKYGAVAFDIGEDGTIDAVEAYGNAAGHTTAALAASALPPSAADHARMGYVTATKSDGAFTFGTTALNALNSTVAYTDSAPTATVYYVTRPTAIAAGTAVTTPAIYDKALVYYIVAQGHLKQKQGATATAFMSLYQAELDRYRADFVDQTKEAKEPVR